MQSLLTPHSHVVLVLVAVIALAAGSAVSGAAPAGSRQVSALRHVAGGDHARGQNCQRPIIWRVPSRVVRAGEPFYWFGGSRVRRAPSGTIPVSFSRALWASVFVSQDGDNYEVKGGGEYRYRTCWVSALVMGRTVRMPGGTGSTPALQIERRLPGSVRVAVARRTDADGRSCANPLSVHTTSGLDRTGDTQAVRVSSHYRYRDGVTLELRWQRRSGYRICRVVVLLDNRAPVTIRAQKGVLRVKVTSNQGIGHLVGFYVTARRAG